MVGLAALGLLWLGIAHWASVTARAQGHLAPKDAAAPIKFEDLIERSGIQFQLRSSISPQRYSIETMLGGVALFDYNHLLHQRRSHTVAGEDRSELLEPALSQ
jgi:hypothetical protein